MANPMIYRSTNADGRYVHFGGAVVIGTEFYNGVEINPSSTNTAAKIEAAGDDANIPLTIVAKGTGKVTLGNSSNSVALLGTVQVGSTATGSLAMKGFFTANSTYSHAAISAARNLEFSIASTTADVVPGDLVSIGLTVDTANLSSAVNLAWYRLSTAATSRVTISLSNVQSTATSTGSGTFAITWADLT